MENEMQARGKVLRERQEAEEAQLEARKAAIPELLKNSEAIDLRAFVTMHAEESKALVSRGSFEKEHRDKVAEVSLTYRAAAELLLDEMEVVATAEGSSWDVVGVSIAQTEANEAQNAEIAAQPTEYRTVAEATVGAIGGADFKFV